MKTGKISGNILKRSVLGQIRTVRDEIRSGAGVGEDCAILAFSEGEIVSCMQEAVLTADICGAGPAYDETGSVLNGSGPAYDGSTPIFTMPWLIQKCANNLAAAGAEPVAVMISLFLPESVEEQDLKTLMSQAENKCLELHMAIAGGQSCVVKDVLAPVAAVSGYGRLIDKALDHSVLAARPGQDVVISKWIGLEGTAFLASRFRQKLLARYPAYLVEEAADFGRYQSILPEAWAAVKSGVCAMHDASEGGIFAALWELAEGAGVGLTIDLKKLPIKQETVEVCECCGANPYELMSGGCLVMTTEDGSGLVSTLQKGGIPAVVVGKVTDSNDRIFVNGDEIRYMDRPARDELHRVFEEATELLHPDK